MQHCCILRCSLNIPSQRHLPFTAEGWSLITSHQYLMSVPDGCCFIMRTHNCSSDQCLKSYWGADGCVERTTRSCGLWALVALHYDHRDAVPTLICLFSFWQFFSLIEHNILHCTKEVILAMSLRFARRNCCFELVFHSLPWRCAGWLLRLTLPCLQLISICHIFKLTSEIGDELSETLGFLSFSSLNCLTLVLSSSPGRL